MVNWIFQGNPKQFDVDTYIEKNEIVDWNIRQKQFLDEVQVGDMVFIWRSDGGNKNTGGVIALCEIVSEPYEDDEIRLISEFLRSDWLLILVCFYGMN